VAHAMREVFQAAECDVECLEIELVDERYPLNLPLRPFWRRILKFVLPQLLGTTAQIRFDEKVAAQDYQLVCIGSPTWWFFPAMPISTFLKSKAAVQVLSNRPFAVFTVCRALWWINLNSVRRLARRAGGVFVTSAALVFQGNQVQTMFSFLNYLRTGEDRERYLGCRIYPFGVSAEGIEKARSFARSLIEQAGINPANNPTPKEH